jgi:hypothetical protein
MVVQCGDGDITEQFRRVRTSEDMVNTRAAKLTAAFERPSRGSVRRSCSQQLGTLGVSIEVANHRAPRHVADHFGVVSGGEHSRPAFDIWRF